MSLVIVKLAKGIYPATVPCKIDFVHARRKAVNAKPVWSIGNDASVFTVHRDFEQHETVGRSLDGKTAGPATRSGFTFGL